MSASHRQHEELAEVQRRLEAVVEDRDALLAASTAALVHTDEAGTVQRATPAAARLVGQPEASLTQLPFAGWFGEADRDRVHDLLGQQGGRLDEALLERPDGSTQPVSLTLRTVPASQDGTTLLRWELRPLAVAPVEAAAVPEAHRLAADLTAMAARLATLPTLPLTVGGIAEEAVRLLPGAEQAVVVQVHPRGAVEVLAVAGSATGAEPGDVLTVPLVLPGFGPTELRATAARTVFGPETAALAELLAVHFRIATARALHRRNLEQAIETRQLIGQAVGVLVERRRVTSEAAFEELVQRSQLTNLKLREMAQIIVDTGQDPEQIAAR